jgi:hypothetical protein
MVPNRIVRGVSEGTSPSMNNIAQNAPKFLAPHGRANARRDLDLDGTAYRAGCAAGRRAAGRGMRLTG